MLAFDDFEGTESIPSYLELSPTGTASSLPVVTRPQILPIAELTWDNFERLCLRYVRSLASVDRCRRCGVPGQDQGGIDLYARFRNPAHYSVYQCKKVKDFGRHEIDKAVEKFVEGKWQASAKVFTICTSHPSEDTRIADAIEDAATRLDSLGIKFDLLGPERLSEWLKDQPSIVDDFFHRVWVKVFCDEEAFNKLADRLTSADVVSLRKNLGTFYSTLFNRHDPGIPIRPRLGGP